MQKRGITVRTGARALIVILCWLAAIDASRAQQHVNVNLFSGQELQSVEFALVDGDTLRFTDGERVVASLGPGDQAVVEVWQGLVRLRWDRGSAPVSSVIIRGGLVTRVTPDGRTDRVYRGDFAVGPVGDNDALTITNSVQIDDYVSSVLPSEYPFDDVEGSKAQAIVIRSYALATSSRGGPDYRLRDDVGSQVYLGVSAETRHARDVASQTAGSILEYDGEIVEAVYSSHCGGHSANNEDVWGTRPVPYLRGRKDPYDDDAPVSRWSTSATVSDVHEILSRRASGSVKSVKVDKRTDGRRVTRVRLDLERGEDQFLLGERFRSIVNAGLGRSVIPSTIFDIDKRGESYHFEGRGNGHGVGFCQWGARGQALKGRSHEQILTFYYQDVDITEAEPVALAYASLPDTPPSPSPAAAEVAAMGGESETAAAVVPVAETSIGESNDDEAGPRRSRRPGW